MDSLLTKVNEIRAALSVAQNTLDTSERWAGQKIGTEVDEMRNALSLADQRIEYTIKETSHCLTSIEGEQRDKGNSLQLITAWLCDEVKSTLADLQVAETKAECAMKLAMQYRIQIEDVIQNIATRQRSIDETHRKVIDMEISATHSLIVTEYQATQARLETLQKEEEIRRYNGIIEKLKERVKSQEKVMAEAQSAVTQGKAEAEKKKERAWLSAGAAVAGVLLVPITFGASGVLIGAGGVLAAANTYEYNQAKDDIRTLESSMSTLRGQIIQNTNTKDSLCASKSQTSARLSSLEGQLVTLRIAQTRQQEEIKKAENVQTDVSGLQRRADCITKEAGALAAGLQTLKQVLNECVVALDREATQLRVDKSVLDRQQPKRLQRARDFQRNGAAVVRMIEALSKAKSSVPLMLTGAHMKFASQIEPAKCEFTKRSPPILSPSSMLYFHGGREAV